MGMTVQAADAYLMRLQSSVKRWPADKYDVVSVYEDMQGVTPEDRQWLVRVLPNRIFSSAEEVVNAIPVAEKV